MTPENMALLYRELMQDEGEILHVYTDSLGFPTVGIGHLITKKDEEYGKPVGHPITKERSRALFDRDVQNVIDALYVKIPWLRDHPDTVQRAVVNMGFQLGVSGLLKFKTTLKNIKDRKYEAAYNSGKQSKWYQQTPNRAERVLKMIKDSQ